MKTAYFNRFTIDLKQGDALDGSHPGPCDDDIAALLEVPYIRRQINKLNPEDVRAELNEYGAWDENELEDNNANRARILWIACGDIREELHHR